MSTIMVMDKEDVREVKRLKDCKNELIHLLKIPYVENIQNSRIANLV
ncbi:MAG: hypothetical protein LBC04_01065 [Holosporaceae bacterium]|nr:hypothetical protein [Holosporaceae bacterium]